MITAPRKVYLYGSLGETFGKEFTLHVSSVAEAIRLFEANFKGKFFKFVKERSFHVLLGKNLDDCREIDEDQLQFKVGHDDIHIVPAHEGAGNKGWLSIILGTVLLGGAIIFSGGSLAAPIASLSAMQGTMWGTVAGLGAALALGGVLQLLTPVAKPEEKGSNRESKMFSGTANVAQQGGVLPVIYGRCLVGSVVGSAAINTTRIAASSFDHGVGARS